MTLLSYLRRLSCLVGTALMLVSLAFSQDVTPSPDTPPTLNAEAEREAREIENLLIAPCCWTQPVSEHYSGAAQEVREDIRRMLAEGKNREQILEAFVQQHGKRILSAPEASGFNSLAYFLPFLFLAAGIPLVVFVVRKLRSGNVTAQESRAETKIDPRYARILEKELRD